MFTPLVSVVTLCHGQGQFLSEAAGSLACQSYDHFELILACGDRESAEVARGIGDRGVGSPTILTDLVRGRADAFNRAVGASRGQYIVRLDADDKLDPTALSKMVATAEGADPVIVTSNVQQFGELHGVWDLGGRLTTSADAVESPGNMIHCSSLFSRELWDKTGGYERALFGHEDFDFWVKCARHAPTVRKVGETLLHYREHQQDSLERRSHAFLCAAIRFLNFPATPGDVLVLISASEEIKDKVRRHAEWFPDHEPAQRLVKVVGKSLADVERGLLDEADKLLGRVSP
jgi:glycosyltransferase involved in cell wall biosynthesis